MCFQILEAIQLTMWHRPDSLSSSPCPSSALGSRPHASTLPLKFDVERSKCVKLEPGRVTATNLGGKGYCLTDVGVPMNGNNGAG